MSAIKVRLRPAATALAALAIGTLRGFDDGDSAALAKRFAKHALRARANLKLIHLDRDIAISFVDAARDALVRTARPDALLQFADPEARDSPPLDGLAAIGEIFVDIAAALARTRGNQASTVDPVAAFEINEAFKSSRSRSQRHEHALTSAEKTAERLKASRNTTDRAIKQGREYADDMEALGSRLPIGATVLVDLVDHRTGQHVTAVSVSNKK